ncbi:MAG: hypothetical protein LC130_28335 [Bryobacterales bacterium]|nr:hypothetical protein [Bryobacterales bacterium]
MKNVLCLKRLVGAFVLVSCALMTISAEAQTVARAIPVERAVPFGTTTGKLMLLGDHLVYVDDQKVDLSFAVVRSDMTDVITEGSNITLQFRHPLQDSSGTSSRAIFRAIVPTDTSPIKSWFGMGPSVVSTSGAASVNTPVPAAVETFVARHDHFRGSCRGRLIVSSSQLSYESVNNVSHSRRWEYRSIKEITQKNPYELEVKPFAGGSYKFFIDGQGISPELFKTLVDRVTAARTGQ